MATSSYTIRLLAVMPQSSMMALEAERNTRAVMKCKVYNGKKQWQLLAAMASFYVLSSLHNKNGVLCK
jgi:hypothetical protein